MKLTVAAAIALGIFGLMANGALAKEGEKSVEASLDYGTEAFNDLGGQFGVTVGFGYGLPNNLQARADLSYFRSSTSKEDMDFTGTRVPLDLGVRYYYPLAMVDKNLTAYGQGGLEMSFDHWHQRDFSTRDETRFGALIGAGAEYALDPHYGALLHLEYHVIENSFFSTGVGMAYHF